MYNNYSYQEFDYYDTHIETAMRAVFKDFGVDIKTGQNCQTRTNAELLPSHKKMTRDNKKLPATFTSIWEEGDVATSCKLDPNTGIVSDIKISDEGSDFEALIKQEVSVDIGSETLCFQCEPTPDNDYIISADDLENLRTNIDWIQKLDQNRRTRPRG